MVTIALVLGLTAGCASVPPPPPHATPPSQQQSLHEDESGGWLFDRLTGRQAQAAQQKSPSGVIAASATEPVASQPAGGTDSPLAQPALPQPAQSPAPKVLPMPATGVLSSKSDEPEKKKGFELSDLAPDKIYNDVKKALGYGPDEPIAREAFKQGQALFQEKKYDEAAGKFYTASWRWPDSVLEEDALFMLGESYFFSDRYSKAKDSYDNLLKKYQNTKHLDTVVARQFAIGRFWEQLDMSRPHWPITPNLDDKTRPLFDTFGNAVASYESVRLHDPLGPLADDSIMATGNAYFRKGRYEDAAYHYDLLRKEYPKSDFQLQAHLLGLQSKQLVYQGPYYEGKPLEDADEIAKQTLTQFGSKLGPEQDRVMRAANRIREQRAQREWAMGQFYEKKKQFGAARYYYQNVLKDFPNTQTAQLARDRIEQIKNEPDVPPDRLKWLKALVPEVKRK